MIFDIIIKNGHIIDPENKINKIANLAILNDKIAAISKENLVGKKTFDATGHIVCPGFIDIHGHIDGNFLSAKLSLKQGITTSVGGNCGNSPLHLYDFFLEQMQNPRQINQAEFIGMTSNLRTAVGILQPTMPADKRQIKMMQCIVEKAFTDGACGLSIGLAYAPGTSNDEIYALCEIAAKYNRLISIDTRLFTPTDLYSLVETLGIARKTGARIQISHFVYQYGTGLVQEALCLIDKAREQGLDIRIDSGMYTQWATGLQSVLFEPSYLNENGWKLEDILIITGPYKGKRLNTYLYEQLRQDKTNPVKTSVVVFTGIEDEIYTTLLHPWCMLSSDTGKYQKGEGHPQIAGSFPRFFHKMVCEKKLLTLEQAIYKTSTLPAQTLGLKNKGNFTVGSDADIVVFDENKIKDNAWFLPNAKPDASPDGIKYVFVNGYLALENDKIKNVKAGRVINYSI